MGETLLFPSLESLIPYAFGLAWKLARSKEEAEDLAQESLLKAWEKRTQLRDAVSVKPWLRSILVTTHLQRLRASEKPDWRRAVEEGGDEVEHIPDPVPEIAALVAADEAVLAMRNGCFLAMARKLTLEQRTVFSLSCMFGLGIKEIAGYLQTSPGAIKALLYRAKTNLAAFFNTHCAWIEDTADCRCEQWLAFSGVRQGNREEARKRLLESLPEVPPAGEVDMRKRARILAFYRDMPDRLPDSEWYRRVLELF